VAQERIALRRGCYQEVTSGGSFGANSLMQHIGLGKATIDSLEIEWPMTRTKQVFRDVPIDSFLKLREFDDPFTLRHPPRLTLRRDMPHVHDTAGPSR
jgi:ASPIC and UnbV